MNIGRKNDSLVFALKNPFQRSHVEISSPTLWSLRTGFIISGTGRHPIPIHFQMLWIFLRTSAKAGQGGSVVSMPMSWLMYLNPLAIFLFGILSYGAIRDEVISPSRCGVISSASGSCLIRIKQYSLNSATPGSLQMHWRSENLSWTQRLRYLKDLLIRAHQCNNEFHAMCTQILRLVCVRILCVILDL